MVNFNTFILVSLGIMLSGFSLGGIITVKQDGTGDYTLIQDAINASSDGDTVLVYPGTYYENINFNGKSIALASLNMVTGDPNYIKQTIIDGNHSGTCVTVELGESVVIHGFKITHGSGTPSLSGGYSLAGGILILESQSQIINCVITENQAGNAGGAYLVNSTTFLSGVTISCNRSNLHGGGLVISTDSTNMNVVFDTIHRCNIYLNFSGKGSDIYKNYSIDTLYLALDTFTVVCPDYFHICETDPTGEPLEKMIKDIRHGKIESVAANLYVSPQGNNDNTGITMDQPLKNLHFALAMIKSSPDTIRSIYLSKGYYSSLTTQENLPVNLRSYINIIGESMDSTIIDGDSLSYILNSSSLNHDYQVCNITLQRGNGKDFGDHTGGIDIELNYNATFKNIKLWRCYQLYGSAFNNGSSDHITLENVEAIDCQKGSSTLRIGSANSDELSSDPDTVFLINCRVHHCVPGQAPNHSSGGGVHVIGSMDSQAQLFYVFLTNCEVTENMAVLPSSYYVSPGILLTSRVNANLSNCTIGKNIAYFNMDNCALVVQENSFAYVFNTILFGNKPRQAGVFGPADQPSELYINYSLVQGGQDSIYNTNTTNIIYYDPTNIDTDPLWDTASMYPYSLSEGSPCIDAGTLNLPPGVELPQYDIAGNPRVWGESVDMGAYEYGPWVGVPPVSNQQSAVSSQMSVSPNPFRYGTYINYELPEKGKVNISVYSISGMKVKTLIKGSGMSSCKGNLYWDGRDQDGIALSSGTYILRLTLDDKLVETVKVVRQ